MYHVCVCALHVINWVGLCCAVVDGSFGIVMWCGYSLG